MTKKYLSNLFKTYQKGDAREESYYKHLDNLITEFSNSERKKKIDVTILPKKTEAGNPDFRIWDGRQKIIGCSFRCKENTRPILSRRERE